MTTQDAAALETAATNPRTDSGDPLDAIEFSRDAGKRACWEAIDLSAVEPGRVVARNESHAAPDAHTYAVTVDGSGVPVACECPADEYLDGACKHRVAAALSPAVVDAAAEAGPTTATASPPTTPSTWTRRASRAISPGSTRPTPAPGGDPRRNGRRPRRR